MLEKLKERRIELRKQLSGIPSGRVNDPNPEHVAVAKELQDVENAIHSAVKAKVAADEAARKARGPAGKTYPINVGDRGGYSDSGDPDAVGLDGRPADRKFQDRNDPVRPSAKHGDAGPS